jgi:hypothetical protein
MPKFRTLLAFAVVFAAATHAVGQVSAIPQLASRPGAAFTLYMNFGGFNYTGNWFGDTPGVTPAYTIDGNANFSATEIANIRNIWTRTAEKFSVLNVNVTTIDPAVTAGQAGSDSQRQNYYDSQARMMHMVMGGNGSWTGVGGIVGYSGLDVADSVGSGGTHTNFTFTANYGTGTVLRGIAETAAHENGHALKLRHQSRWNTNGTLAAEYDSGTAARAPIMGNSDNATRGLWRKGTSSVSATSIQNDLGVLLTNNGMTGNGAGGFMDSGIGHSIATATPLPLNGTQIDFNLAKGIITPNSSNPEPLGEANYTTDFFKVTATGLSNLSVTLRSGRQEITPGTADPGYMLDATLRILDGSGTQIGISSAVGNATETVSLTNLAAGDYYIQISSAGADAQYFDVGSYFLTGQFIAVPEPAMVLGLGAMVVVTVRWRRSSHGARNSGSQLA